MSEILAPPAPPKRALKKDDEPFLRKNRRVKKLAHPNRCLARFGNPFRMGDWMTWLSRSETAPKPIPIGSVGTVIEINQTFVQVSWDGYPIKTGPEWTNCYLQEDAMVILQPID